MQRGLSYLFIHDVSCPLLVEGCCDLSSILYEYWCLRTHYELMVDTRMANA